MPRSLLVMVGALGVLVACSSSTGAGVPVCNELKACCAKVAPSDQPTCLMIAESGVIAECDAQLTTVESQGTCTPDGGFGNDSGPPPCTALEFCCTQLTGAQLTECKGIVAKGNQGQCDSALAENQSNASCS